MAVGTYQEYLAAGGKASEAEYIAYNKKKPAGTAEAPAASSQGMVNVGGKMVPENQTFSFYNGYGTTSSLNAAQAADTLRSYPAASGGAYGDGAQWTLDEGDQTGAFIKMNSAVAAPAAAKPAAAPAPSSGGGFGGGSALNALPDPVEPVRAKIEDVSRPAAGLESTIKTSPTLLREKRRKSYLTAGA